MQVRYGAVPEESLCTENLTPWRKLLPCKSVRSHLYMKTINLSFQDGLISLLNPYSIYATTYSTMGLNVIRLCQASILF